MSNRNNMASPFSSAAAIPALQCYSTPAVLQQHDLLSHISSMLRFGELPYAMRTCKLWYNVVCADPPSRMETYTGAYFTFPGVVLSPLGRYIDRVVTQLPCTLADLFVLQRLPNLRHLQAIIDTQTICCLRRNLVASGMNARPNADQTTLSARKAAEVKAHMARLMPSNLHSIELTVHNARALALRGDDDDDNDDETDSDSFPRGHALNYLVDFVSQLHSLKDVTLNYGFDGGITSARFDITPLASLAQLTSLAFHNIPVDAENSFDLLGQVKQLTSLERFSVNAAGGWDTVVLAHFCAPPHRLQKLTALNLNGTKVTMHDMTALLHLPALTELSPNMFTPAAFAQLPHYAARLRTLRMAVKHIDTTSAAGPPLADLALKLHDVVFVQLTSLTINGGVNAIGHGDLRNMLTRSMPHVHTLVLVNSIELSSLDELADCPALHTLNIRKSSGLCCFSLLALARVPSLRTLYVDVPKTSIIPVRTTLTAYLKQVTTLIVTGPIEY